MNDPFARLPVVPSITVTSTDVTDGQALPLAQMTAIFGFRAARTSRPSCRGPALPGKPRVTP
jgi:hypothetical protein